jgi:F0F1-type ATP synthase assembly protein I
LDHLFGTAPLFLIVFTILGAVGLFAKLKYRYDDRMAEHEADRVTAARSKRGVA